MQDKMPKWSYYVFIPGFLENHPIYPHQDLDFDNMLVRQMFMLHISLGEAYPPKCTAGYDTKGF